MSDCCLSTESRPAEKEADLIIVGGGSAAFAGALKGLESGARIVMINDGIIGGTCVNVGCVPSKTLIRAAEAHHRAHHAFDGIQSRSWLTDFKAVIAQKDQLVASLRQKKYSDLIEGHPDVEYLSGKAVIKDAHTVKVADRKIRGEKILIATGASPYIPPVPGLREAGVMTSTEAFEMKRLPETLIVLGGRYIALELAQIFARFGTKVTVLQRSPRILPDESPEFSETLCGYLRAEGIDIRTGVSLKSAWRKKEGIVLTADIGGEEAVFSSPHVVAATGRRANTKGLGLEAVGVALGPQGEMVVDDILESAVQGIFGAGDVIGAPQFVYTAAYEGALAVENALTGQGKKRDYRALPWVIFTDPQAAGAGMDEAQAKNAGIDAEAVTLSMAQVPRALAARDTRGWITLVRDRATDRLVGGRILAPEGGELVMEISLALKYGITATELSKAFHPYLTNSEALKLAALSFRKSVDQLSCCAV
ncbi:MAG: mercury(II) reductase [Nitrospiria bacterium]